MRVMVDTNVFISALLSAPSVCGAALDVVAESHELVLCDYLIQECYEVANRKFPARIRALDKIFAKLRYELVPAPRFTSVQMSDAKDQPILNAAIEHGVDIVVSGDKHFLALDIETPEILSPKDFLLKYQYI